MATEFCTETREDISDSCHSFYNRSTSELRDWYERKKHDCRTFCTCNGWPWRWPCCVARAACLAGLAIAYGVSEAALAVAYAACLAAAIIVHVVCVIIVTIVTIVLEVFEFIVVVFFFLARIISGIICGATGWCCNMATVSGSDFVFADGYENDDSIGKPENSDSDIFASRTSSPSGLRLQYLGTNSLHISDGETDILVDPYFSRPEIPTAQLLFCQRKLLQSNREVVEKVLDGTGILKAEAIVLTHTHFDHALDVVEVWNYLVEQIDANEEIEERVYPKIIGSRSTWHLCRGGGIPDEYIEIVDQDAPEQESYEFNEFTIQLFRGKHINLPVAGAFVSGTIGFDLTPPVDLFDMKEGGTFSIYVSHELGTILNLGSANYLAGALGAVNNVDHLILGVAGFDSLGVHIFDDFQLYNKDNFYREVVTATNPGQIYFSHWDDYHKQLSLNYPSWYKTPTDTRDFFIEKNESLVPLFLPIGGYINLEPEVEIY